VSTAPKSNRAYVAVDKALEDVKQNRTLAVPPHLRTKSRKKLAKAAGVSAPEMEYQYSHDSEEGYIPQAYLPEGRVYYEPSANGMEAKVRERLDYWRKKFEESQTKKGQ
jgi:putative ATPase